MYKAEIIRELFSEQEVAELKSYIDECRADQYNDEPQLGRSRINMDPDLFPKNLLDKVDDLGKKLSGSNIGVGHIYTVTYSAEFGRPDLPPHLDPSNAVFCIDYQLESNTIWDIAVEGVLYRLKDNNAVTIPTSTHAHWRKQKSFAKGEFVTMVFFHFNELDFEVPFTTMEQVKAAADKWMPTFINNNYIGNVVE